MTKDVVIKSAHCDCMADISESSNHAAALLFRVEAAVTLGLSNPACTAKPCEPGFLIGKWFNHLK